MLLLMSCDGDSDVWYNSNDDDVVCDGDHSYGDRRCWYVMMVCKMVMMVSKRMMMMVMRQW